MGAIDFLPWGLVDNLGRGPGSLAGGPFLIRHQRIQPPGVQVQPHPVAGLQIGQTAAHHRFRRCVQDGRGFGRARLPPVAHRGQVADACADQRVGRLHVHHLGRAGIAHAAHAADEQDAILGDVQGGVIDAGVVILGAFEHDGARLVHAFGPGMRQEACPEIGRDHRCLHQRAVEQVARQHQEPRVRAQGRVMGADHIRVPAVPACQVFAHAAPGGGQRAIVDAPRFPQFAHHRRHPACTVEPFAKVFARGLHVDQQRHVEADRFPVLHGKVHPGMAGDGLQVRRRVGGPADGRVDDDGIFERRAGQDLRWPQILQHHRHRTFACFIGHGHAFAERRRNGRIAGQRHAQRLGHGVHRAGGAHGVAMAQRGGGRTDPGHELLIVDRPFGQQAAAFPHDGAGPRALAFPPAVQHRPAVQGNRRNVHRGRAHQQGRRGLVAARAQHHPVDGIAVQHLDKAQVGQVAVQRGGGPLAGFLDGVDGKFHRNAAAIADARLDAVHQEYVDLVAGRDVAAGIGNADDRAFGLQLLAREALVLVAFQIERGHPRVVGVVEPFLRPEPPVRARVCHGCFLVPSGRVTAGPCRGQGSCKPARDASPPAGRCRRGRPVIPGRG